MSILEIIAITFTLICVYLTSKQNIWCWPTGIVGVIAFLLLFFQQELYFQTSLQVVFLLQSIYGWYIWNKAEIYCEHPSSQPFNKIFTQIKGAIVIPLILVLLLVENPKTPDYLDAVSTGLSLLATWWLVYKRIEAWIVWMIVNVLLFSLMLYQGLYIVAGLEVILFTISLKAFLSWRKDLKRDYA